MINQRSPIAGLRPTSRGMGNNERAYPMTGRTIPDSAEEQDSDMFRLLVASVKDYSIFLLDPNGYIRTWNEGAQRTKGYRSDEIIGKHFSIFYSPQDVRHGKPDYGLRVAVDEGRWEEEGWRFRKDGSRFWADVVVTALYDTSGKLVGFAKVTRDLSERKRADDERRQILDLERLARMEAEATLERLYAIQQVTETALTYHTLDQLLHALIENISEILLIDAAAVILLDEDDPNTLVTRSTFGSAIDGTQGKRMQMGEGYIGRIASERQPLVLEDLESIPQSDPLLDATSLRSVLGVPLLLKERIQGVLLIGVVRHRHFSESDIQYLRIMADRVALAIEHIRLYDVAQIARIEAEVAETTVRTQNEFISIAAHELKTPLTSVKAAAQMLLLRFERHETLNRAQAERGLRAIERQTDRMTRLITLLLDTARLQVGRITIEPTWTNITDLVQEIVQQTEVMLKADQLVLHSAVEDIWASVDRLRIEQVVTNLIDNAIKFSPVGEQIEVGLSSLTAEHVQLTVRDHGIGIAPEQREHLFERFYQAHATNNQSGLGLGLYISREIVVLHGGTITVDFPADGGTCFVVTLPLTRDRSALVPDPERDQASMS